tara:strand:- start:751 stop:1503 length:753 start_codon:yes stop_codon:yes gene_type:complete
MFEIRKKNYLKLKKKLNNNQITIGYWFQASSSDLIEAAVYKKNIDWAVIDLEHGSIMKNQLTDIFRTLELNNIAPLVRVDLNQANEFNNYLDIGAYGIIVSNIKNHKELIKIKNNSSYLHKKGRGHGFYRANCYGSEFNNYKKIFKNPIIIPMIENNNALQDIDNILKTSNTVFIGPYDLSNSLGYPGNFKNKLFKQALRKILNTCKKNKKNAGIHCVSSNKKLLNSYKKDGFKFIAYSMDTLIYKEFNV